MSGKPQDIWIVGADEYDHPYVPAAFTSEKLAEEYARANGGYVEHVPLYDRPVLKVPYYQYGADVYPDGTVERWQQEHESDEPGMEPVEPAEHLHEKASGPWDGHMQGHCGYHVSVFGSDRELTREACEHWVAKYLKLCNGVCPGCGRTEDYTTDFWHEDLVNVVLKGGPLHGQVREETTLRGQDPGPSSLVHLHGTMGQQFNSFYSSPEWDVDLGWVRPYNGTREVG